MTEAKSRCVIMLDRFQAEINTSKTHSSHYECRLAQLRLLRRYDKNTSQIAYEFERHKALWMEVQLEYWMSSFVRRDRSPKECMPKYELSDIDNFVETLIKRLKETP